MDSTPCNLLPLLAAQLVSATSNVIFSGSTRHKLECSSQSSIRSLESVLPQSNRNYVQTPSITFYPSCLRHHRGLEGSAAKCTSTSASLFWLPVWWLDFWCLLLLGSFWWNIAGRKEGNDILTEFYVWVNGVFYVCFMYESPLFGLTVLLYYPLITTPAHDSVTVSHWCALLSCCFASLCFKIIWNILFVYFRSDNHSIKNESQIGKYQDSKLLI